MSNNYSRIATRAAEEIGQHIMGRDVEFSAALELGAMIYEHADSVSEQVDNQRDTLKLWRLGKEGYDNENFKYRQQFSLYLKSISSDLMNLVSLDERGLEELRYYCIRLSEVFAPNVRRL